MHLRSRNGMAALWLCAAIAGPARAQYTATLLPLPAGSASAQALGASEGQQVGVSMSAPEHALLWNNVSGSLLDLHVGSYSSIANAAYQGYQGGAYIAYIYRTGGSGKGGGGSRSYFISHAVLWHGSPTSMVDMNPAGAFQSTILGLGNGQQVGWATGSTYFTARHATLWSGTAASAVNLEPAGFSSSEAVAVDSGHPIGTRAAAIAELLPALFSGLPTVPTPIRPISPTPISGNSVQVGYGTVTATGAVHALLWYGSPGSAVDLHPTGFTALTSYAVAVDAASNQQAGSVNLGSSTAPIWHACLWNGTAAGALDLNPADYSASGAAAVRNGYQAGSGVTTAGATHALLWHGSAASALDLHAFLPSGFISSQANSIDQDGSIVGSASDGHAVYPVVWKRSAVPSLVITQDVPPGASGWITQNVTLTIASPFKTPDATISYRINGGPAQSVSGSLATLPLSVSDAYEIEAYAANGQGLQTPSQLYTLNLDQSPPQTTLAYAGFTLTLTATDAGSGVATTYYILDGGATNTYKQPLVLANTAHTVEYWSTDRVGNVETHQVSTLAAVAPTLTILSPNALLSGSPAFTLTVTGTGFIPGSVVQWNGAARTTTYLSPTQLQASISDTDLATAGAAQVTVTNPAPGTGTSGALTFSIPQQCTATGSAANISEAGENFFDLSPVSSHSGFTFSGATLHISTDATTLFLDSFGGGMTSAVFFDNLQDGQGVQVAGTYDAASHTLTAWIVQLQ